MNTQPLGESAEAERPERRSHRRFPVRGHRRARCAFEADGRVRTVAVADISRAGVLVKVPAEALRDWPALREPVANLELEFDDDRGVYQTILSCEAVVAWLGGTRRNGERVYRCGLEFVNLTPEQGERLDRVLASLGRTDPTPLPGFGEPRARRG